MPSAPRIALVSDRDGELYRALRASFAGARLEVFEDAARSFEAIRTLAPAILVHGAPEDQEELGVLRVLRAALPGTALVLAAHREHELVAARHAERLGARLLLAPFTQAGLAAAIAAARRGPDLPGPDAHLDLLRGIADEINNPLLAAGGQLQLAECLLEPRRDADALARLRAARAELDRIARSIQRIALLARVRGLRHPLPAFDLVAALDELFAEPEFAARAADRFVRAADLHAGEAIPPIAADRDSLPSALRLFLEASAALAGRTPAALTLQGTPESVRLVVRIESDAARALAPQDAFEPYHLARVLRGTPHGLALFLVQSVVHAHGGAALAEREPGLGLVLRLELPRVAPGA